MKDSIPEILKDIMLVREREIVSPADDAILDICERLAAQQEILSQKIAALDRATTNARSRTARI